MWTKFFVGSFASSAIVMLTGLVTGVLTATGTAETRYSPLTVPVTIEIIDKFPYYLPIIFK